MMLKVRQNSKRFLDVNDMIKKKSWVSFLWSVKRMVNSDSDSVTDLAPLIMTAGWRRTFLKFIRSFEFVSYFCSGNAKNCYFIV